MGNFECGDNFWDTPLIKTTSIFNNETRMMFIRSTQLLYILLILHFIALPLYAQSKNIKVHEEQWNQINAVVINAFKEGNYEKGLQYAEIAYQYALENLGQKHVYTLTSINNLALLYQSLNQ